MHPGSSPEHDSSSSCSTASPGGDNPACSQHSSESLCSASSMDSTKDPESSATDSFVPTVTTISTSPDLKWMVQPTVITTVSPSPVSAKAKTRGASTTGSLKEHPAVKKGKKDQPSKEEEERRRIRRERNKIAAAKCRNRRRELTDTLQAETDKLEEEKASLQTEIADLLKEKERLEHVLASHKPICKLPNEDNEVNDEDDVSPMQQDPPASPLLSMLESAKTSESNLTLLESPTVQDMEHSPCATTAAILGNSNILLCSSAEEEPLEDLKGDDLDDLVPSLEMTTADEVAASVPDIDLGGAFCLPDWETLYKSVANDLESLSTPVVSSSPTCSNYRSAFSFNGSEIDSLAESCESLRAGLSVTDFLKASLNSPTLLAL